jgi:hypothetical protein
VAAALGNRTITERPFAGYHLLGMRSANPGSDDRRVTLKFGRVIPRTRWYGARGCRRTPLSGRSAWNCKRRTASWSSLERAGRITVRTDTK